MYIKLLSDPDSFFTRKTGESEIKVQKIIFHENVLIIPKKARHYPEETKMEKDTCIPLFIAALFTIARTWNQPRCP